MNHGGMILPKTDFCILTEFPAIRVRQELQVQWFGGNRIHGSGTVLDGSERFS